MRLRSVNSFLKIADASKSLGQRITRNCTCRDWEAFDREYDRMHHLARCLWTCFSQALVVHKLLVLH
jgi:hypothetical protein